jgi:hypothetical protein
MALFAKVHLAFLLQLFFSSVDITLQALQASLDAIFYAHDTFFASVLSVDQHWQSHIKVWNMGTQVRKVVFISP